MDRMQIPRYPDGSQIDSLIHYFDVPVDSAGSLLLSQTWIPWGKLNRESIFLDQIDSMKLDDGIHYYLIIYLMRAPELREFTYLVEVHDDGSKLGLRKFFMFDNSELMLRNLSIRKKKEGAVWMVRHGLAKGEFDGRTLTFKSKYPPL
jgi:hypothetical protein